MSKVNLKDYKKENRGLLRKSVEERVTYKTVSYTHLTLPTTPYV